MEKFLYYNDLYVIYKELLKSNQREIFELYYRENLSMQEIADLKNISKSRVGVIIKNVQKKLENYESSLKIYHKNQELNKLLELSDLKDLKNKLNNILQND